MTFIDPRQAADGGGGVDAATSPPQAVKVRARAASIEASHRWFIADLHESSFPDAMLRPAPLAAQPIDVTGVTSVSPRRIRIDGAGPFV
ncbi:MAG: hypothetical protein ACK54X_11835 [Burkholderiales bacterium]|jgi:hypothetical protein